MKTIGPRAIAILIIGLFVGAVLGRQSMSKHTRQDTTSTEPATSSEIADLQARIKTIENVISNSNDYLLVEVVTTNLVSVPCKCGYCRPNEGIRVPEHINQIGYDLEYQITTSRYPVVSSPSIRPPLESPTPPSPPPTRITPSLFR